MVVVVVDDGDDTKKKLEIRIEMPWMVRTLPWLLLLLLMVRTQRKKLEIGIEMPWTVRT